MRFHRFLLLSLCASVIIITSCSEEVEPSPFTFSKNFTGNNDKTWRIEKLVLTEKNKKDQTRVLSPCESDDLYKFYANDEKLFEVYNGSTTCDSDGDGIPDEEDLLVSYSWSYASANANLTMVVPHIFGYFVIPFVVKKVDSDEMQLQVFVNEEGTISYLLYFKLVNEN
jgi:hypothetical protein